MKQAMLAALLTVACSSSPATTDAPEAAPQSESTATLSVGDAAPAFSLPSGAGEAVSLASLTADGPAVLVFYRGDW